MIKPLQRQLRLKLIEGNETITVLATKGKDGHSRRSRSLMDTGEVSPHGGHKLQALTWEVIFEVLFEFIHFSLCGYQNVKEKVRNSITGKI